MPPPDRAPVSDRRRFLAASAAACAGLSIPAAAGAGDASADIEVDDLEAAQRTAGLAFTRDELEKALPSVRQTAAGFAELREHMVDRFTDPAMRFDPFPPGHPRPQPAKPRLPQPPAADGLSLEPLDLAFAPILELQARMHAGRITSRRLTELCLERLQRFDAELHCVVTLLRDHALAAADRADAERAAGRVRGPLHGIPFGAKDLLAHPAGPTTFGAAPFRDQHLPFRATVLERLEEAGAVLCAKLTLGALAMGDRWFGGMTRNPWNPEQGSSGSSAGSAAATAAGLLPFALGTETLGSIVSPAVRCAVTGLRPTFGAVPRTGCMPLSWSMDKIGVLARSAVDCGLVYDGIRGPDGHDLATIDGGLAWDGNDAGDLSGLRLGLVHAGRDGLRGGAEAELVAGFAAAGAELRDVELPDAPYRGLRTILGAEAATAFDDLTRNGGVRELTRQDGSAWPNLFRAARFVPAVEYLRANRARTDLMRAMAALMDTVDALVAPTHAGSTLLCTNLTGHPTLCLPFAAGRRDQPRSIALIGRLFGEGTLLRLGAHWQRRSDWHRRRPPLADR